MALDKRTGQDHQDEGEHESDPRCHASRLCWAMLLARLYEIFPLLCPRCSSAMHVVAFITQPEAIERILGHLGEPVEPPPVAPAREGQLRLLTAAGNRGPPFSGIGTVMHEFDG